MTFTDSDPSTPISDLFFRKLLAQIDGLPELKVTVYALWRMEHMDGKFRALSEPDFDERDLGLGTDELRLGLEAACKRGSLLRSEHDGQVLYFLNSPQGRSAAQGFAAHG